MDKDENRDQFIEDLWKMVKMVKMTDRFRTGLERHTLFGKYMKSVEKLRNPDQIKIFVLLELTKDKECCDEVIRLLEESQQNEAALKLKSFNGSVSGLKLNDEVKPEVKRVSAPQPNYKTSIEGLSKNPRGKCLIVNFMEEPLSPNFFDRYGQTVATLGLKNQTIQFGHVFTQLGFDTQVISDGLNANQLKQKLQSLSKSKGLEDSEAFVFIVVAYGQNEEIVCGDGSKVIRDIRFGVTDENAKRGDGDIERMAKATIDVIAVKDIVALFSEKNCPALKSKSKLFFFSCCRIPDYSEGLPHENVRVKQVKASQICQDVFLSYSSANGYSTFYDHHKGLTHYGQALCQSIAKYACSEPLDAIMSRTTDHLKKIYEEEVRRDPNILRDRYDNQVIEYNTIPRKLYFNPGFYE